MLTTHKNKQMNQMKAISYIRVSSRIKQGNGPLIQRQLDETRAFCERHKLNLDESLSIMDVGNRAQDNLETFIEAVKAGKIEVPIVLCVQSLERITRQEPTEAAHFRELLLLGIQIGLVSDDKILTHETSTFDLACRYFSGVCRRKTEDQMDALGLDPNKAILETRTTLPIHFTQRTQKQTLKS